LVVWRGFFEAHDDPALIELRLCRLIGGSVPVLVASREDYNGSRRRGGEAKSEGGSKLALGKTKGTRGG